LSVSTRDLSELLEIPKLQRLMQSLAMLDAMLSPEWEYRFYSFNAKWDANETLGSMRTGEGDAFFVHFCPAGCFIKGFHHTAPMSPYERDPECEWPGVIDSVPKVFQSSLNEPAFGVGETTFAIWRGLADAAWQRGEIEFPAGDDPDGSAELLKLLDGDPERYVVWAEKYYEHAVDRDIVRRVYAHEPLAMAQIARLNRDVIMEDLIEDVAEIGYPAVVDFPGKRRKG